MDRNHHVISLAKLRLFNTPQMAFTASLCSMLETVLDDNIPYGATDGKHLYINPTTFNQLSEDEQVFLLAHETLHVAYLHVVRKENRNHVLFNMACDYVINLELVNQGFKMIDGGLIDRSYANMSAEEVYEILLTEDELPNKNPLGMDIKLTDDNSNEVVSKVVQAVHQAQRTNKHDSIPAYVQRFMNELHKPKVNWKTVLSRFMLNAGKSDYSWRKPNRRLLNQGMYLPSLNAYGLSKITFAIDTSGSVNDDMFNQFISEIKYVIEQMKPETIEVMLFDTKVKATYQINSISELKNIKFVGYGGTAVTDTINQFNKSNSKALIVITDGYFDTNLPKPKRDCLWVIFDNPRFKEPFGKTILMEM